MRARWFVLASLCSAVGVGCEREIVPEPYVPTGAHDAYRHSLVESGLGETALGRDWQKVGDTALRSPVDVEAPFKESIYVDSDRAFAASYRFDVLRGQRIEIQLALEPASDWRIYLDLFREPDQPGKPAVHVASGGKGDLRLAFEPREDGRYLLRLHSELLRGGGCVLEIRNVASLDFPVAGHDTSSIGSTFGAEREAGRRVHHGVDIFARRHTDVLATSDARVRRVDEWKLGGNIIWLEDPDRGLRIYFAHLQTQEVEQGAWVKAGERIGTVGNSGNARTTPPHLHFGVYVRGEGPIDPYPFLHQSTRKPRDVQVTLSNLGQWIRTKQQRVALRPRPGGDPVIEEIGEHTPLYVAGGSSRSYRVVLPNGLVGYVAEDETESLSDPVDEIVIAVSTGMLDRPAADATVIQRIDAGATLDVLAKYASYVWVDSAHPRPAWIETSSP